MTTDSELIEGLGAVLYDRSIAGHARDEAPPWLACPHAIRGHWTDIARAALMYVRLMEDTAP